MSKGKKRPVVISDSDDSDENLDEELLKLVATPSKKAKPEQHVSSGSDSSDSDDDWQANGKPKAKAKKRKSAPARVPVKRMPREESLSSSPEPFVPGLEEGELSEPNEQQQQSLFMSPSASDSDSEPFEFDDGLDEDMLGDAEDRKRLAEMTEAEREQELYMRIEKREAMKTRLEIKRKLEQAKRKEQRQDKLHSSRALRPKDKRRSEDKTKSRAIDELKAKRQARKTTEQSTPRLQERYNAAEVYSLDESSESSDHNATQSDDDQETGEQSEVRAVTYVASVEELAKVKLSRYRLEKWIHMPFFEDVIKGCFVRVGIGNHDGRPVYRIAEVVSVQETNKVYSLGSTKTNKGLKLRHALQERLFRIEYVSNSNFTSIEFDRWRKEMEKVEMSLPTKDALEKKVKDIDKAKTYEFSDEQIDQIVQEKEKFRKNPRNYAMTKNKLLRDIALAEQEGQDKKKEKLKQQLEDLEERAEELDKQRMKGLTAISYINERNRQNNLIRAEEALKEEFANKKEADDPFTRRKCMPTLVHLTKDKSVEGIPTMAVEQSSSSVEDKKVEKSPTSLQPKLSVSSNTDQDDLFSAHDFDIHIDLPTNSNGAVNMATPKLSRAPKDDTSRRSLNLSDYKKRKGLI